MKVSYEREFIAHLFFFFHHCVISCYVIFCHGPRLIYIYHLCVYLVTVCVSYVLSVLCCLKLNPILSELLLSGHPRYHKQQY